MNKILSALALACLAIPAQAQTYTPEELATRTIERRAVEAVNWGMSAVNYDLMLQEMLGKTDGEVNQVVYWSRPLDWHNQTLTPNPDAIYFMAFFDTRDAGPIVLEIPPASDAGSLNANIVDLWQVPLEDAGLMGIDKGAGVKFLIVPPGYDGGVPEGYTPLRPETFGSYGLLRSNLKSHGDDDVARSVAYGQQLKVYPLSDAANPLPTVFTDAADVLFDSTIRYDASFFTSLDRIVQSEPWLDRDRAMIDILRSLGIEKGKPFNPDEKTKAALDAGAKEAQAWLEAKYDAGLPQFYDSGHWTAPALPELLEAVQASFADPDKYPVDARGLTYSFAYIGIKRLGAGQFYLVSIHDKDGKPFDGSKTYRLTVPPDAPVEQYWSVTAYDRQTHALIRNMDRASRSSQIPELQKHADGSIDIFFGPSAPEGMETNWIPTDPERGFEAMFRLYGPTKALFDKAWVLTDIEEVSSQSAGSAMQNQEINMPTPVTVENFIRAESDLYFSTIALKEDGFGKFEHHRELTPIDAQTVVRQNRDTLYSAAVFDLDAGPVTITLPDAGERFMSVQIISEDQYSLPAVYAPAKVVLDKAKVGTRYVLIGVRTLVDPRDPADLEKVHALQDAIKVEQPGGPGKFEVPSWDPVSQKKVRDALITLASTLTDTSRSFGTKDQVDPVQRLVSAAATWGGNPPKDAIYLNFTPAQNDGKTVHTLEIPAGVPVDGFWSISLYNAEGYFQKNDLDGYSLNNIISKPNADGSVSVQFGGCDGKVANCLPIMEGWNYTVRLYRPRAEILDGSWKFPEPQPAS